MASNYQRHRRVTLLTTCLLVFYVVFSAFPHSMPFPFFNWSLYSATPKTATVYDVVVTSVAPSGGKRAGHAISLHLFSPEFHRDWYPSPYKNIQKLGWLLDKEAWRPDIPLADKYMRDYFTDGLRPVPEDIRLARALVENYLRYVPYAEYQVIKRHYDIAHYEKDGGVISQEVIASFIKGSPHP